MAPLPAPVQGLARLSLAKTPPREIRAGFLFVCIEDRGGRGKGLRATTRVRVAPAAVGFVGIQVPLRLADSLDGLVVVEVEPARAEPRIPRREPSVSVPLSAVLRTAEGQTARSMVLVK